MGLPIPFSTLKILKNTKKFSQIWDLVQSVLGKGGIYTEHCLLTSYFCTLVSQGMKIDDERALLKWHLAALLHDIGIEFPKNIECEFKDFESLTRFEEKMFKDHVHKGIEKVGNLPTEFSDVAIIMRQHHERPDGKGFPARLDSKNIHPLSALFIIAHEASVTLLSLGFEKDIILNKFKEDEKLYSKGRYLEPFLAFMKLMDN